MVTLFTIPKAFQGPIDIIQRNAIRSWTLLQPPCEIILLGDDPGTAEIAQEFGLRHIPKIVCNQYGTPLVNDIFGQAEKAASHDFVCYVNADIILMSDFRQVLAHFTHINQRFLLIGQRWDLDLDFLWNFDTPDWEIQLRQYANQHGQYHHIGGMDFFAYRRGLYRSIPPLALGRCVWDNWLVFEARNSGAAVVNITESAFIIHQNHDYAHVAYSPTMTGRPGIDMGPERKRNMELVGWPLPYFDLRHSTHIINLKSKK